MKLIQCEKPEGKLTSHNNAEEKAGIQFEGFEDESGQYYEKIFNGRITIWRKLVEE